MTTTREVALCEAEAEAGVVGAFLLGLTPAEAHEVRQLLPVPECFGLATLRHAYAAAIQLIERGVPVDTLTVRDELARLGRPCDLDALAACADAVPTTANVRFHAKIVRDRWLRRELVRQGEQARQRALALDVDIADGYAETVTQLVQAAAPALVAGAAPLTRHLFGVLERIEERERRGDVLEGVSTGLTKLDQMLGGWVPGRLVVAAARPGIGKTAFAIAAAIHAADQGVPVYLNSLEMSAEELTARMIAAEAGISLKRLGKGQLRDEHYTQLAQAAGFLATLPITLDTTAETPGQLRLALQHFLSQHPGGVGLVIVDYLGLMRWPGKTDTRNDEIGKLTRALKRSIAMGLQVPVLCLAQLSRKSVESGKPRPPQLADLRESGNIEQDADQVVMLHYDGHPSGVGATPEWGDARRTELFVRKNRHGPGGKLDAYYDRPTGAWNDYEAAPEIEEEGTR